MPRWVQSLWGSGGGARRLTPGWQRNLNRNRCGLPVEAGERRGESAR